ncbi:MAG: MATE family efflux transporter [Nitrospirota bacterium]
MTRERTVSLTEGSLWTAIWKLSWPMLLIMVFNFLVGLTDIYVAGFISPDVQASVGFVSQIYFLIVLIANAISIGTVALLARELGAGNMHDALAIAKQSILFGILAATGLTTAGVALHREIIAAAGFPVRIRPIAEDFLKIFSLAIGPNYILIITNAIFRSSGEVKKTLFTMSTVSVINIFGCFTLALGLFSFPRLEHTGIGLATASSVTIGMITNFVLLNSSRWKSIFTGPWSISTALIKRIVMLSWPAAMLQIAWNAGSLVLYNILGRLGNESITALASLTNGLRIEAVIYLPAFALNMASSVLVGQNLGARNPGRAEKVGWKMAIAGITFISVMALIIFIWAERFAAMVTRDPAVLKETARYLRVNMLSEPFMALSTILGGGLQGAGDTRGTMWIIVIAMWLIRLPLAYILALVLDYGALGVWSAMVTSMSIQGILMTLRFHKGVWKNLKVD